VGCPQADDFNVGVLISDIDRNTGPIPGIGRRGPSRGQQITYFIFSMIKAQLFFYHEQRLNVNLLIII
jgi:hypothetical protein